MPRTAPTGAPEQEVEVAPPRTPPTGAPEQEVEVAPPRTPPTGAPEQEVAVSAVNQVLVELCHDAQVSDVCCRILQAVPLSRALRHIPALWNMSLGLLACFQSQINPKTLTIN